jgi:hypothetical protein
MNKEECIGDGLYASFDGWQFCLRATRENGDHFVYLDPYVLAEFDVYRKRCMDAPAFGNAEEKSSK